MPLGNLLGLGFNALLNVAVPAALGVGTQFASGLIARELNRSQRNDAEDAFKAALRAAASAVSPTVAIGQTAVAVGGPATGTAFDPPTLIPPSIVPANRVQQTNPNFFPRLQTFGASRRDPSLGFLPQPVAFGGLGAPILRGVQSVVRGFRSAPSAMRGTASRAFGPRAPIGRQMAGVVAGAAALETGAAVGLDFLFPDTAFAPGRPGGGFPLTGDPLRIGAEMPAAPAVTGLPSVGRFQKEANGCIVQWYFWDGTGSPQPIDRSQANCFRKDCIFRLDVFRGKFVKMGGRRMNPMNVRAFFRAGRRVDAGERICRKMFSEKRKQKTGTIQRKSKHKSKK